MPTVSLRRRVAAAPAAVWEVVSEPDRLAAWWPGVTRVEDASPHAWTTVLVSPRGKQVRADFTRDEFDPPRRMTWRQELEESPFERVFSSASTAIRLEPESAGATVVEVTTAERLRGRYRLGGWLVRRAARRRLDAALAGIAEATE